VLRNTLEQASTLRPPRQGKRTISTAP
jgi:hypothetical protein